MLRNELALMEVCPKLPDEILKLITSFNRGDVKSKLREVLKELPALQPCFYYKNKGTENPSCGMLAWIYEEANWGDNRDDDGGELEEEKMTKRYFCTRCLHRIPWYNQCSYPFTPWQRELEFERDGARKKKRNQALRLRRRYLRSVARDRSNR